MYETAKERVKLLKAGISQKTIEGMYIAGNDIKIIKGNLLYVGEMYGELTKYPMIDKTDINQDR